MKQTRSHLRWHRLLLVCTLFAVISINVLAWTQAWAMTHFATPGEQVPIIESLSLGGRLNLAVLGVPVPRPENHFTPADGGYAYDVHTIPLPNSEWLEAWWVAHPQPRGIVLLFHGYAASKQQLLPPAQVLYGLGYSTFLVDFRGSGGSSGTTTTLGIREAEDVTYAVDYVRQTWPGLPIVLYSTSMGSSAVLRSVAVAGVQPGAIIAETPFDQMANAVRARMRLMNLPTFPAAELLVFWGSVQQGFNGFTHNPSDYARTVTCPTVLLRGDQDTWVLAEEINTIYERLPGPKQLVTVPGVGHDVLLPLTPEVQEQVQQFLWQVEA